MATRIPAAPAVGTGFLTGLATRVVAGFALRDRTGASAAKLGEFPEIAMKAAAAQMAPHERKRG